MENANGQVIRMNIETLLNWIDYKYNCKYQSCLESLRERFIKVYSILKVILENMIELNDLLKGQPKLYNDYKGLIENIIRILDMTINEVPEYLDLEFVDSFFDSIKERIQIFWAHFHPIDHITHENIEFMSQISNIFI